MVLACAHVLEVSRLCVRPATKHIPLSDEGEINNNQTNIQNVKLTVILDSDLNWKLQFEACFKKFLKSG